MMRPTWMLPRPRLRPDRRDAVASGPKLLTFEATYSLETIRDRGLEHEITCRDLNGFFDHVWSVHPAVGCSREHSPVSSVGSPSTVEIAPRHTMIEGKVGQCRWLAAVPVLNFAVAQAVLLVHLTRLVRREGITIIRAGDPYYLALLGLLIARTNGLPMVVRINGNYDAIYEATGCLAYPRLLRSRAVEKRIERYVLSHADLVAAGSVDNLNFVLANGGRQQHSTIFAYGTWIDPMHFAIKPDRRPSVRAELGLVDRPFVVLVSRLETVKHPEDVLHAFFEVKRWEPDLAAVFVGDGTMRGELESMAADLGVTADVRFVGNRDQAWIASALASADVVLSPLTGRALVEACLSATPVVAYDVEWHSELVANGQTGILVAYRDVTAMAEAARNLLAEPHYATELGARARATTLESMDPARLMEHERSEYRRLLGPCGRSL